MSGVSDYLKEYPFVSKVLFTDKVSKANALIRQLNNSAGTACSGLAAYTVRDYAREIVTAYHAWQDAAGVSSAAPEYISSEAGAYILENILKQNEIESFKKESLTRATVRDIRKCMDEIRINGLTDAGKGSGDKRLKDLLCLLGLYEDKLEKDDLYDDARTVDKAVEYLREGNTGEWMFGLDECRYIFLSGDRFSRRERELMELLASISGNALAEVSYIQEFAKANIHASYSVYSSYGIANEVKLVADRIYDISIHSARIAFDSVSVYYSNPRYINFIKAAFDAFNIKYKIVSGNPARELNLIRFMLSCLECAENDMLYADLEKVVLNPLATFKNISEDNVVSNPVRAYYSALSAGIGWGRERYEAYIRDSAGDADPYFVTFLKDLIDVFDESHTCSDILSKLIEFTDRYTFKQNPEKKLVKEELYKQVNNLTYINDLSYTLPEKTAVVREAIEALTVSDDADRDSVNVCSVDDAMVPERPVNFFIGMSSVDFTLDTAQSSVLSDKEKTDFIEGAGSDTCNVELAGMRNERRKLAVKKALMNLENNRYSDAEVIFTYLHFDTTTLRESSPAVILYEIMKETGCVEKKAPGYESWGSYPAGDIRISTKDIRESVKERAEEIRKAREERREKASKQKKLVEAAAYEEEESEEVEAAESSDDYTYDTDVSTGSENDKERSISASGLQVMLACPLKYYYRYVCHLRDVQQLLPESHVWLGAAQKGTLCHRVMEDYFNEVIDSAKSVSDTIDEDAFERIFNAELIRIEKDQPCPSEPVKNLEEKYYRELNKKYLDIIHKEWYGDRQNGKEWKVIGCEIDFGRGYLNPDRDPLIYQGSCDGKTYSMPIDGSIDRLDGYMDGNILKLRIVDYKTGRLESKREEVSLGIQIQHYMYAMAAIDYLKSDKGKDRLNQIFGSIPPKYEFESICYAFPYEAEPEKVLETIDDVKKHISGGTDIEKMQVDFPEEISRKILGTICRWNQDRNGVSASEISDMIRERISAKFSYLYEEGIKEAQKKNPNADKPKNEIKFGQKEFCEKNYCAYIDVCRKWVGMPEDTKGAEVLS